MYPRLSDIFEDLFGIEWPFPIYSFGAMIALAALVGGWLFRKELQRMYEEGRLRSVTLPSADQSKTRKGRSRMQQGSPAELTWTITMMAILVGLAGSRLLFIMGNLGDFFLRPFEMLFASGGFTFYGGLILAAFTIAWYVRRKGLSVPDVADAMAPSLMIGYGIGRIGCHLAGDGDWGIPAEMSLKPDWLPTWLWAETYPNNILGVDLVAPGVYPTPLYEFFASVVLFALLWSLRKHPFKAGWLFSLYLLVNGVERFLIEKIRINEQFDLLGFTVTQAQVVAVGLFIAGLVGLALTSRRREPSETVPEEQREPEAAATPA